VVTVRRRPDAGSPALAQREQILQAALAAIEVHGPDALTGQIAERAGLARLKVFRHFSRKDNLELVVARSGYQQLRAEVRSQLHPYGGTAFDVIRAPIAAQVTWVDNHPNLYRFLVSCGHQRISRHCKAARRDFAAELAAAGARYFPRFAQNPNAAEVMLIALIGFIDASVLRWLSWPTETREQLIDRLTAQAWLIIDHHLRQNGVHIDPAMPLPRAEEAREVLKYRGARS
jgi:AcrR family transcriptional regulator